MLSFHMFVSSSVSFTSVYNGGNGSFGSLGRFIPSYFFLLDVMVNGIVSFISHSDISLLVYRNATDFWVLILYPTTLPNSLLSSSSFLIAWLGVSMYRIMSSTSYLLILVLAALGLHCCVQAFSSCRDWGWLSAVAAGFSLQWFSLVAEHGVWALGMWQSGSVVVAHGLSCPMAYGILQDQESNPCLLHRKADS